MTKNKASKTKITSKIAIKCLIILGATATGKSAFAVELAKKLQIKEPGQNNTEHAQPQAQKNNFRQFHPEIISADSRQVYKGLDIGSGKITQAEMQGVPHHLIDVADPTAKNPYTVVNFISDATNAIKQIAANTKLANSEKKERTPLPIICGGTGFYISAFTEGLIFPEVKPGAELSAEEKKLSAKELYSLLLGVDPARAKEIGPHNKARLVRALELAKSYGGKVPEIKKVPPTNLQFLKIGLMCPPEALRERIKARLVARINTGMVDEVRRLLANGVTTERLKSFGLEYKYVLEHITNNTSTAELTEVLTHKIWQLARRQMTWFKRDKEIVWVNMSVPGEVEKVLGEVERFLE